MKKAAIEVTCTSQVHFDKHEIHQIHIDECQLSLGLSENIDMDDFISSEGIPNQEGCELITINLIAALCSNIHFAHQMKFRDSAQHLRYIISELEKGFVLNPTIENVETYK